MIGEIRDAKTAHVVLEAAYTGHLVLSTLHTSSVMASLLRCLSFGCDPFMLRYALKGIISQTLLPKKCVSCDGAGCVQCDFKGVLGRVLLSEMLRLQEPTSVGADPAAWIEEGDFYAYNADTQAKQKLGWI
jgi:type II secretory ATPase GspE/PulE/Tfp pilus assembly ATPase PilB-like protein